MIPSLVSRQDPSPKIITRDDRPSKDAIVEVTEAVPMPLGQAILLLFNSSPNSSYAEVSQQVISALEIAIEDPSSARSCFESICLQLMKAEEGRDVGYELARLWTNKAFILNPILSDLVRSSDPLIRHGAIKMLFSILNHHFETAKLLGKSEKGATNSKIQIVNATTSMGPKIDPSYAMRIQDLVFDVIDTLRSYMDIKQPTLGAIIVSDTLVLISHAVGAILADDHVLMHLESDERVKREEQQEVLLQKVKQIVKDIPAQLLLWFGNKRPLYASALSYLVEKTQSPSFDAHLDFCARFSPELLELPFIHEIPARLPLAKYVKALEGVSWSDKAEGDQKFEKVLKIVALISKASPVVQARLFEQHREAIILAMCSILENSGVEAYLTSLAVGIMDLVGIGKFEIDVWFLDKVLTVREWKSLNELPSKLLNYYLCVDRKKEVRIQLLNKLLQNWNKSTPIEVSRLSTNSRWLLLYLLKNPNANPLMFAQLSAYVQKNAAIPKIQKLVDDSVAEH